MAKNESAVAELGDETLKAIARDLVRTIRDNWSIDWDIKESVRAKMRSAVRRILVRYDYPPDAEREAIELVIEQAEMFAADTGAFLP